MKQEGESVNSSIQIALKEKKKKAFLKVDKQKYKINSKNMKLVNQNNTQINDKRKC